MTWKPPIYALLPAVEREAIAQQAEKSQNGLKEQIAKDIRSGDLFDWNGEPKSYWHCLATLPPEVPQGRRGQWKAIGEQPSGWTWQDWGRG